MINTNTTRDILEAIRYKSDPIILLEEHIDFKECFVANDGRTYIVQNVDNKYIELSVLSSTDIVKYHYARQIKDEDTEDIQWYIYSPTTNEIVYTLEGESSWVKVADWIYRLDLESGLVYDYREVSDNDESE